MTAEKEKLVNNAVDAPPPQHEAGTAPPAYTAEAKPGAVEDRAPDDGDAQADVAAAFANLTVSQTPLGQVPAPETCVAHLKFLHAIQGMKEDVGYTDGLWNIWDTRVNDERESLAGDDLATRLLPLDERRMKGLSRIREKRWAIFVARAVDRYEAWWNTLPKNRLTEQDMSSPDNIKYDRYPIDGKPATWEERILPPLDVLMVMHSHMLSPRSFLEDTMRDGLLSHWTAGFPWQLISDSIDARLAYDVSDDAKAFWVGQTGRNWENQEDSLSKDVRCPYCSTVNSVPWTSCGLYEKAAAEEVFGRGLGGTGYGDGDFKLLCSTCGAKITKETLSLAKFVADTKLLLVHSIPIPGTILDAVSGKPQVLPPGQDRQWFERTFPNRMIQLELRIKVTELFQKVPSPYLDQPDMTTVRNLVETASTSEAALRRIDSWGPRFGRYAMRPKARVSVRKMMSRYWENFSPFALDLCGAVMRQGVFVDKMTRIDWLHSPSARDTMARLTLKYSRFLALMQSNPNKFAVPTLDVDLAWHTHQLSPQAYYDYTVTRTDKFIDHDDKVDESKLSDAFEWTSQAYQDMFGEIYSECTCWYCESIRTSHVSSLGKLFGVSQNEKIAEAFYKSGAAKMCPPDNSAHISSHNAVKTAETTQRAAVTRHMRLRHQQKLDQNYQKAVKRAEKKGRKLPPREQYYDHWGYNYYMYSPFMYPIYFAPGMYYGWDPGYVSSGSGAWANCAAGTCGAGSGVAAGACGGAGGCGGSTGACASGGDGGGGGGGGCGGGGGGGCGGGGGGGGGCGGGGS